MNDGNADIINMDSRSKAIGIYHAVSCRDAASFERDGKPYIAMNELPSSPESPQIEILFGGDDWFLADPRTDLEPFTAGCSRPNLQP